MDSERSKKALIISVSDYQDENLEDLDFCKNDGNEMYAVLNDLGYSIENKFIGHVKYNEFKKAIYDFFRKDVNPSDTLLFYLTGHGFTDEYGEGFFCTSNIDLKNPGMDGFPFSDLTKQMSKSDSQSIVAILDCCYSGATLQSTMDIGMGAEEKEDKAVKDGKASLEKEFKKGRERCVLASSLSNKVSFGMVDKPYSAFSYFILEGLKPNRKTVDDKGYVTPEKLSLYVSEELKNLQGENYQKPVYYLPTTGKLILAEHKNLRIETSQQIQITNLEKKVQELEEKLEEKVHNQILVFENLGIEKTIPPDKKIEIPSNVLVQLKEKKEEITKSIKHLEQLNQKPKIDSNYILMEASLYYYAKEYERAIGLYDSILKNDPKNIDALNNKGIALGSLGKYPEAIPLFDKVLEIDPKRVNALCNKGAALGSLGKYPEAILLCDKALEIDPKKVGALYNKGATLDKWGKIPEAIHWYTKVLEITPKHVDALHNKGYALGSLGKLPEAITFFDKVLKIDPNHVKALFNKGTALHDLHKYPEAISVYDKVLKIDPNHVDALKAKEMLKKNSNF